MIGRTKLLIGAAGCVCILAAACSSSSGSSSAGSSSTPAGTTGAGTATGSPIVFSSILGPLQPADDQAGINAAIDDINAHGGVDGHPLKVIYCMETGDANSAAACARSAVANKSVVAEVSDDSNYGSAIDPILASAGVPMIGGGAFTPADFSSKDFFAYNAETFETVGEATLAAGQLHAKKIYMPYIDVPAGRELPPLMNAVLKPAGLSLDGSIPIPATATDLSSYVAAVKQANPDVIITALTTDLAGRFVLTARQEGLTTPIFVLGGVYDPYTIQTQLGSAATNLYVVARLNLASPAAAQMNADLNTYDPNYKKRNDQILARWGAVHLFDSIATAALKSGPLTRASILNAANHTTDWSYLGLTPPVNFTKPQKALGGTIPNLVNTTVYLFKWDGTKLVPLGGAKNVFGGG